MKIFEEKNRVLDEVTKGLSLKEKMVIAIFKDLFYYVYRKGMIDCFNYYNI